jgi:hypothetical protein
LVTASPLLAGSASRPSVPDQQTHGRRRPARAELDDVLTARSRTGRAAPAGTRHGCHRGAVHGSPFPTWLVDGIPVHAQVRAAAGGTR